jgi:anti-sigma factor RsiW
MLNGNDLELLSAYIDGALSDAERAALEARLQTDAELRRELARLRATVDLVKTLPTLPAPRNFTLTRQAARRPSFVTSATFSALSTAAAVILLIVGVALYGVRSQNSSAISPILATQASDQVALAPTETSEIQQGVVAPPTQTKLNDGETGAVAIPQTSALAATSVNAPLDTDASIAPAPPVANLAQPSEAQSDDTSDAQGVDGFMQYATGTPLPTQEELSDVLRFAAEATETRDEFNTQSRVDEETETQTSQDLADASASLSG